MGIGHWAYASGIENKALGDGTLELVIGDRRLGVDHWALDIGPVHLALIIWHWGVGLGNWELGVGHRALGIGNCRFAHSPLQMKASRETGREDSEESVWRKRHKFQIVFVDLSVCYEFGTIS